MCYIYLLLHHLFFTIIIFVKHYLYFCKIRSNINLSRYRSSNERYRYMQLMSLYRMCRDIVLTRYSSVTIIYESYEKSIIMVFIGFHWLVKAFGQRCSTITNSNITIVHSKNSVYRLS